jgi:membrane protease YdiL (CAAX protease family)
MNGDRDEPWREISRCCPADLAEETLVVRRSLLASAVFAILSLLEASLARRRSPRSRRARSRTGVRIAVRACTVWLVAYRVRGTARDGSIGLRGTARGRLLRAPLFAASAGTAPGAVALGVNRFVVPVPPVGHWWTVPMLFVNAAEAALLEEVVVVAYLVTRLRQLGLTEVSAVGASALLRGSYHLYQGWGGFLGNVAMGVLFGLFSGPAGRGRSSRRTSCSMSPRGSATCCSGSICQGPDERAVRPEPSNRALSLGRGGSFGPCGRHRTGPTLGVTDREAEV